jgi:hypothetical protein
MAYISATVYSPPKPGLPHLAVLLYEGDVLAARACNSIAAGEAFIAKIMPELQAKIDSAKEAKEK